MQVILREEVSSLGTIGDLVKVRDGYARNYLLPRGLAVEANPRNLKELEHKKRVIEDKKLREQRKLQGVADRIATVEVTITARAGEEGKLFGSVTSHDIQQALEAKGIEVERKRIILDEPIKHLGEHTVSISLGYQTKAKVQVNVVAESDSQPTG